ncbi:hypothetical protein EB796_016690 [Bugula neritina]|uniref:Uncharacterized protein n=1 Tax=Bugula neritina TaxID=10212 RepID=A0A7J7JFD0_BUGNE|nr:hypothetical protein EB796_016690 [Bugula neritina]
MKQHNDILFSNQLLCSFLLYSYNCIMSLIGCIISLDIISLVFLCFTFFRTVIWTVNEVTGTLFKLVIGFWNKVVDCLQHKKDGRTEITEFGLEFKLSSESKESDIYYDCLTTITDSTSSKLVSFSKSSGNASIRPLLLTRSASRYYASHTHSSLADKILGAFTLASMASLCPLATPEQTLVTPSSLFPLLYSMLTEPAFNSELSTLMNFTTFSVLIKSPQMNALTHALALPLAERHGSDTLIHQIRVIISSSPLLKVLLKVLLNVQTASLFQLPFQMNTFLPKVTSGPDAQVTRRKQILFYILRLLDRSLPKLSLISTYWHHKTSTLCQFF